MIRKSLVLALMVISASLFTNSYAETYRGTDNKAGSLEVGANSILTGIAIGVADGILAVKIAELLHTTFGNKELTCVPLLLSFPIRNQIIRVASAVLKKLGIAHDTNYIHLISFSNSVLTTERAAFKSDILKYVL